MFVRDPGRSQRSMIVPAMSEQRYDGLRRSLFLGAAFDVAFGLPALLAPGWLTGLVGVELTDPIAYRLIGLLLLMLAGFYAVAGADPVRHRGNVVVAVLGRLGGCVLLLSCWWRGGEGAPMIHLLVALSDGMFAAVHAWFGRRLLVRRRKRVEETV